MSNWQIQLSLEQKLGQKLEGLKIGSCVQMKDQYLFIFCFFLSFILWFSTQYSNMRPRRLSGGIEEDEPNFLRGSSFLKSNFYFPPWNPGCYPWENIQTPLHVLEVSYVLFKVLLLSSTSSLMGYWCFESVVGTCFVSETSPSHTHTASGIFWPPKQY